MARPGGLGRGLGALIPTGTVVSINSPKTAQKLTVTRPDNSKSDLSIAERGGAVFEKTDQVGFYDVAGTDYNWQFAASLASAQESDISPRPTLLIEANPQENEGRRVSSNHELLPLVAVLGLLILCVEWWVFHKRMYAG